jgi:hypothetical protein
MLIVGWFLLGLLLGASNLNSIQHAVSRLFEYRVMRIFWTNYVTRLMITGCGLLLAVQWGIIPLLAMFLGILIFHWALLFPSIRNVLIRS